MSKNTKLIFGFSLVAAAVMIMLFSTMPSAGSKEVTVSELSQNRSEYTGHFVLTQGLLNEDSVKWDAGKIQLDFELIDQNTDETLDITYNGVKPDNFSAEVIVIVEGKLEKNGVFVAEKVQTKCPSKYEGEDMEDYDEDMHKEIYSSDENS
ncbi:cytochrome c maturation protein CcmE [Bacillus marinisedimentorum]|uniref:cytochrome c maturation protein CcmE n=1 Tax=Bacillus marinisedimentorum TaxID=1821260 RepID=UPI0008733B66|nr:cytochrome c maturation protein CcmE [Bacillus marinisedimentorum]